MRVAEYVFAALIFHLMYALPIWGAFWFWGRKRAKWHGWEFPAILIPWIIWAFLFFRCDEGKSLSNLAAEPILVGWFAIIYPALRVIVGEKSQKPFISLSFLAIPTIIAVLIWKYTEGMLE